MTSLRKVVWGKSREDRTREVEENFALFLQIDFHLCQHPNFFPL